MFIGIIPLNCAIIFLIRRKTSGFDKTDSKSVERERKVTQVMLIMMIVFVVLKLPKAFTYIIKVAYQYGLISLTEAGSVAFTLTEVENVALKSLERISFLSTYTNSAINFIIYFRGSEEFRQRFRRALLHRIICKDRNESTSSVAAAASTSTR